MSNGRVELSLKTRAMLLLEDFAEGQVVRGRIKRVEKFGVFIRVRDSPVVGMAHVSEVADERVKDLPAMFRAGQGESSLSQRSRSCGKALRPVLL
jgi:rRNA biogenesis protein RRP5